MENPEISPEEEITSENARTENTDATNERTESVPAEALEQSESSKATLDDMTLEPQAAIEQSMDYAQAEEIERTLTALVETAESTSADTRVEDSTAASTESTIEATPITLPSDPPDSTIEATPITLPIDPPGSTIEATPITLPIDPPGSTIEAMPINTPGDGMPVTPEAIASVDLIPENDLQDENEIVIESVITGRAEVPTTASSETARVTPVNTNTENTAPAAEPAVETTGVEKEQPEVPSDPSESSTSAESTSAPETDIGDPEAKPEKGTATDEKTEDADKKDTEATTTGEETKEADEEDTEATTTGEETGETDEQKWTPPEVYIHHAADGSYSVVDANGKQVNSPPNVSYDAETGTYTAWYTGDPDGTKFEAKAYKPILNPENLYVIVEADGTTTVVDSDGKPVVNQPDVYYDESTGSYIPIIDPVNFYVHIGADGTATVVDSNGKPVDSPPVLMKEINGETSYFASYLGDTQSSKVELSIYKSKMKDFFVHVEADGSYSVVDANGKPVDSPPDLIRDINGDTTYYASYFGDTQASKVELSIYKSTMNDFFVHAEADGSYSVVDANGKPVDSPPTLIRDMDGNYYASYFGDTQASKVELPIYKSTMKDFFVHVEADGSYSVVDANGKPVDSPPDLIRDISDDTTYYASYFGDTQGSKVKLETYKPEIKELFFHLEADGSVSVVDANGVPVDSPPNLSWGDDYSSGKMIAWYTADPNGTKTTISLYKPSAGSKNNIPE